MDSRRCKIWATFGSNCVEINQSQNSSLLTLRTKSQTYFLGLSYTLVNQKKFVQWKFHKKNYSGKRTYSVIKKIPHTGHTVSLNVCE